MLKYIIHIVNFLSFSVGLRWTNFSNAVYIEGNGLSVFPHICLSILTDAFEYILKSCQVAVAQCKTLYNTSHWRGTSWSKMAGGLLSSSTVLLLVSLMEGNNLTAVLIADLYDSLYFNHFTCNMFICFCEDM